jgi:flagellar biosynthesis/type III secretory pathway protein FliH
MGRLVKGPGHLVAKVTLDARAEAAALLAEARREATALVAGAASAREEARRQGFEEGRAQAVAETAAALAAVRAEASRALEAAIPVAVPLASKMAERIVGRAVALDPEVMAEIAAAALAACRPGGALVRFRLHPDDLAAVAGRREALARRVPASATLDFVADESVGRHGCVIETPRGRVDARLETQLAALERALVGGRDGGT